MPVTEERGAVTANDQTTNEEQLTDAMKEVAARMKALVKDAKVDLDEPIDGDVEL